jgi:hypothetical protein
MYGLINLKPITQFLAKYGATLKMKFLQIQKKGLLIFLKITRQTIGVIAKFNF